LALAIALERRSHEIKRQFWSRKEYRVVKLSIETSNPGEVDYEGVSYEVLVPERALFDLSGDDWGPEYLRTVDDVVYDVWEDNPSGSGLGFPHDATKTDVLGLHLQPNVTELTVLGRMYVDAEPVGEYTRATFAFPAFVPGL
jgi:hypothetical protein